MLPAARAPEHSRCMIVLAERTSPGERTSTIASGGMSLTKR